MSYYHFLKNNKYDIHIATEKGSTRTGNELYMTKFRFSSKNHLRILRKAISIQVIFKIEPNKKEIEIDVSRIKTNLNIPEDTVKEIHADLFFTLIQEFKKVNFNQKIINEFECYFDNIKSSRDILMKPFNFFISGNDYFFPVDDLVLFDLMNYNHDIDEMKRLIKNKKFLNIYYKDKDEAKRIIETISLKNDQDIEDELTLIYGI